MVAALQPFFICLGITAKCQSDHVVWNFGPIWNAQRFEAVGVDCFAAEVVPWLRKNVVDEALQKFRVALRVQPLLG